MPCNWLERDHDGELSPELFFLNTLDEFLLHVDSFLSEHTLGDNGQFPLFPEAVYLYIFTGLKFYYKTQQLLWLSLNKIEQEKSSLTIFIKYWVSISKTEFEMHADTFQNAVSEIKADTLRF